MDFGWSSDMAARYDDMRAAVRDAVGRAAGDGFYTRKDWLRLGELGLLGLSIDPAYGGGGLGALDTARLTEAFGRDCPDTGLVFGANAHLFACAMPIAEFGGDELRRRLLP